MYSRYWADHWFAYRMVVDSFVHLVVVEYCVFLVGYILIFLAIENVLEYL